MVQRAVLFFYKMLQYLGKPGDLHASSHNIHRRATFTLIPRETGQRTSSIDSATCQLIKCKALLPKEEKIQINVSGKWYQLTSKQLQKFPRSLLGDPEKRGRYHDAENDEIFFDRNRTAFESVYNFYLTEGKLVLPKRNLSGQIIADELHYFGVYDYLSSNDKKYNLPLPSRLQAQKHIPIRRIYQRKVWKMCEISDSSNFARALNLFSLLVTLLAVVLACVDTLPSVRSSRNSEPDLLNTATNYSFLMSKHNNTTFYNGTSTTRYFISKAELFCVAWFTVEVLVRFIVAPEKRRFFLKVLNIIDIASVFPFYISLIASSSRRVPVYIFKILRFSRIFQVLKLSRLTSAMKVVGKTAEACVYDLWTVFSLTFIGTVLFGITVYYCEQWDQETIFHSIPDACWWAVVTITTLGYGDMVPKTLGECQMIIFIPDLCA